jgi:hypothetical protein
LTTSRPALAQFVKGATLHGADRDVAGMAAAVPAINLLTWPRSEPLPALQTPVAEIVDLLVATGERIASDPDGLIEQALRNLAATGDLPESIVRRAYANLPLIFGRRDIELRLAGEFGPADRLDGWCDVPEYGERAARLRAFPPRMVHILAGNAPAVAALTIVRGALSKGVHLLKLPSNDLFTATAILRSMAAVAPDHPVVRSFSAVYWRGGDAAIESALLRPQFFDKLAAWGGESAIRTARSYLGPGLELISFDPKTSVSFIGREAFASDAMLGRAVDAAATDASIFNQLACSASRVQFVEGDRQDVDRFCELLQQRLGIPGPRSTESAGETPADVRDEVEALRLLQPLYRAWGGYDGKGLVIRSDEPVEFYPSHKTVNVVPVDSIEAAIAHVGVATQTVGVFPGERKAGLRDRLAAAGVQRIVTLGSAAGGVPGVAHDGFLPIHRFMRWVNDED